MRPRRHVVIMARAPRLGTVKRRLARDVGALAAWRFYRANLQTTLRRLARERRWVTWLAVTPDAAARRFPALPGRPCRIVPQGRGDLGRRMGRLVRTLPPGPVAIVGSDIPGLDAAHVAGAFRALGRADWVFGPAADGGYWLIGAARRRLPRDLFAGVRWSSAHALADTVATLGAARIAYLEVLGDVDSGADLARHGRKR